MERPIKANLAGPRSKPVSPKANVIVAVSENMSIFKFELGPKTEGIRGTSAHEVHAVATRESKRAKLNNKLGAEKRDANKTVKIGSKNNMNTKFGTEIRYNRLGNQMMNWNVDMRGEKPKLNA